MKRTKIY